ncbi:hypothetical protein J4410_04455 [Candidatus Woesearchaeota archaeon]|nr:hypothetical protein [Candidatus Woesearchaeota archaeon]
MSKGLTLKSLHIPNSHVSVNIPEEKPGIAVVQPNASVTDLLAVLVDLKERGLTGIVFDLHGLSSDDQMRKVAELAFLEARGFRPAYVVRLTDDPRYHPDVEQAVEYLSNDNDPVPPQD